MRHGTRCGTVDSVDDFKHDIRDRNDIEGLLRAFYAAVYEDDLLARIFRDVAQMDVEAHLPVIGDFWEKVLFNTARYAGGAMAKHRWLHEMEPLTQEHFERWLSVWRSAVDARHSGHVAERAKWHAAQIALAIQRDLRTPRPRPAQGMIDVATTTL